MTWTADSAQSAIRPGEYQEFPSRRDRCPAQVSCCCPPTQTYSDGQVVAWDERPTASGEEPEHPSPALTVIAADSPAAAPTGTAPAGGGSDPLARGLGLAGLAVGGAGVALAVLAGRRAAGRLPT